MVTIAITLFIAIIGALMYAFATNGKLAELGRLIFACGFLAFCLALSSARLSLG